MWAAVFVVSVPVSVGEISVLACLQLYLSLEYLKAAGDVLKHKMQLCGLC